MNRKEFITAVVGMIGLGVVAPKAMATSNMNPSMVSVGIPTNSPPPPPDTRTVEEIVSEQDEQNFQSILRDSEKITPGWYPYKKYPLQTNQATFDRLLTMDLPVRRIGNKDYIIRNGWPITTWN